MNKQKCVANTNVLALLLQYLKKWAKYKTVKPNFVFYFRLCVVRINAVHKQSCLPSPESKLVMILVTCIYMIPNT